MRSSDDPPENGANSAEAERIRPAITDWLWRPWSARLWWGASAVYWTGKLAANWVPSLDELYATALAGYLNIVLYPGLIAISVGLGFARVWMEYHGWDWVSPSEAASFRKSVGGYNDPMADRLDPRSPAHWRYLDDMK